MPRRIRDVEERIRPAAGEFAEKLAEELKGNRESGQPVIYEEKFASGKLRVTVIWDDWERIPHEDRTAAIFSAYERALGHEHSERIALASGLTVPEAYASGMLPYEVIAALRKNDPVTRDQCHEAMLGEGASLLLDPEQPRLRFATEQEAEACIKRLSTRLSGSEPIWVVTREVGPVEDWAQATRHNR